MKEFGIFFEDRSLGGIEVFGEETKGEVEVENSSPTPEKPLSSVLQVMKDFNSTELMEILGISSPDTSSHATTTTTIAPTTKRGKGRKKAEPSPETEEEPEENKRIDDPKRNAIETLKREINLMEADRDR